MTDPNDLYSAMSLSSRKQRIFRAERVRIQTLRIATAWRERINFHTKSLTSRHHLCYLLQNLYLAGFCFALIFIIRRLFQLAAQNADLVDEIKVASGRTRPPAASQLSSSVPAAISGTETAPVRGNLAMNSASRQG